MPAVTRSQTKAAAAFAAVPRRSYKAEWHAWKKGIGRHQYRKRLLFNRYGRATQSRRSKLMDDKETTRRVYANTKEGRRSFYNLPLRRRRHADVRGMDTKGGVMLAFDQYNAYKHGLRAAARNRASKR
jgi:hypothetical protein